MGAAARLKCSIALNALVVVLEIVAIGHGVAVHGVAENFVFYTECSNLMGGIACALCMVAEIRAFAADRAAEFELGRKLCWLKYASCCCLLMTLFVVVIVLAPAYCAAGYNGYYLMFCERELPVTHLLGPLLVFASYVLFEAERPMALRQSLYGLAPTLAYAAVAYPCNIARVWEGPYPFFFVWNMPVWQSVAWFLALCAMATCLCQIPRLIGNKLGA